MTRGLYPPDSLSKDNIRALNEVRKDIWYNGLMGGGFGAGSGLILHTGAQWARRMGLLKSKLDRNTLMLSVLGGGAFGMFLFATKTGKQEVHNLHPIFQVGSNPKGEFERQDYRSTMSTARGNLKGDEDVDMEKMKEIRLTRRRSLMDNLERGQGLSDSHGGQWQKDENVDMDKLKEIRITRRRSLMDNLEQGHGLSDSHGGHWYKENDK